MRTTQPEPRWPAAVIVLAAVALHFALPAELRVGPPWVGAAAVVLLVALGAFAAYKGREQLNQEVGYVLASTLTIGLLYGVGRLIVALPQHRLSPRVILQSATVLWAANVIVFAVWYWRLDAGGPNERDRRRELIPGAFLFAQMTLHDHPGRHLMGAWRPHFVDYLFLSFNTSTAFSPTDVAVLGRWAKVLTMVQALISLTTVVVLVARAINML
jgi:hypothetical protein